MAVKETITAWVDNMNQNPEWIRDTEVVYQLEIYGEGIHQLRLKRGAAEYRGEEALPSDCTIQLSEKNFIKLAEGRLNPTTAFMTGKLKVKGDLSLALRLSSLLKQFSGTA
ncbi:MAG: SCP2 sterol-binding domain-containing protein [Firmicutes bacterium]|uniref:Putative sterol carrier protein n=1 Tax=Melghirimyces thermohalophilus TaxID=1236220 RepID=A0A1G6JTT9_9BACL|nr:SCP2 sterol-binding domain-containing protein [Melghirimyces thermohalophilus]MDA8351944.1 SCP2 sterol-binding domain-containing protein [Bacillota bacterium]SDC22113.1 Putative sterol carrier protein [Melghirimyces thermohalophilus]